MKEDDLNSTLEADTNAALARKLQARLLLGRPVAEDRLMLADVTLLAALDGSRPLTPNERVALEQSPLTLRRFRALVRQRRANPGAPAAANDAAWGGSAGMLRAAASAAPLAVLQTDDRCWSLHFIAEGQGWQVVLKLEAGAPFAPRLLREQPLLRVLDGAGATVLQGRLDHDGECEQAWPFAQPPAPHFHLSGGAFAVEPVAAR